MQKHLRVFSVSFLLLTSCVSSSGPVLASPLEGKVEQRAVGGTDLTGAVNSDYLQGGIKNEETLRPSLDVIPGQARKSPTFQPFRKPFPNNSDIVQYRGNRPFSPEGRPIPGPTNIGPWFPHAQTHYIPPISTYSTHQGPGVTSYSAGYSVSPVFSSKGVSSYVPGLEVMSTRSHSGIFSQQSQSGATVYSSHKGVTSYAPGYETKEEVALNVHLAPLRGLGHIGLGLGGLVARQGVVSYVPGYEVKNGTGYNGVLSHVTEAAKERPPVSINGVTTYVPGYEISISTPKNGVVCYNSKYEFSLPAPVTEKHTIGGMYYTPANQPVGIEQLRAPTLDLDIPQTEFAVPVVDTDKPLKATAMSLPGTKPSKSDVTNLTWDDWYKQVGRAIYQRWQTAEVGPGLAKVRVVVNREREISCQVADFVPAAMVERNVDEETEFKRQAMEAVNTVSQFEIPTFPSVGGDVDRVSFEVEMKRTVDGPTGVQLKTKE